MTKHYRRGDPEGGCALLLIGSVALVIVIILVLVYVYA
jgi:hypothetical protein